MKICQVNDINNNVYVVSISTSDFSEADTNLMTDFGEPTINVGGSFGGTVASHQGVIDLSGGHDWNALNETFSIDSNGAGPVIVTLDANCADLDEVITEINSQMVLAAVEDVEAYDAGSGHVGLRSIQAGAGINFVLAGGAPDALVTLGMATGTYTGSGAPNFEIPDAQRLVRNESPFIEKFDARDEVYPGDAQASADLWASTIITRIKSAMTVLRANTDGFSGESCETY